MTQALKHCIWTYLEDPSHLHRDRNSLRESKDLLKQYLQVGASLIVEA